jgi:DNA ligase-1
MKSVILAPNEQIEFDDPRIRYPMLGSVKFDGTRCVCVDGELLTRNMKPQKNKNLYRHLAPMVAASKRLGLVFDMELYDHTLSCHGDHTSILAAHDKPIPESMIAHYFDCIPIEDWRRGSGGHPFSERIARAWDVAFGEPWIQPVAHRPIKHEQDARFTFADAVGLGYEGIMLRCPNGLYKHGRATIKESNILKFKAFETMDGEIIEVMQRRKMKDGLDRTLTPTGHMERIHTKDSFDLDEMVGAFKVRFEDGTVSEANYGRGFDHETRRKHWEERVSLVGRCVEVRHLPHGAKDGVRIGTLVRFRPDKE